jgi:four helix bundle protein
MFLKLRHTKMDVYSVTREFLIASYQLTQKLPPDERFNLTQQIRRAALSVMLNLAEGSSRKTPRERSRFYQIARGSIVEMDAALDVALDLGYLRFEELDQFGNLLVRVFQMISNMISGKGS